MQENLIMVMTVTLLDFIPHKSCCSLLYVLCFFTVDINIIGTSNSNM